MNLYCYSLIESNNSNICVETTYIIFIHQRNLRIVFFHTGCIFLSDIL